MQRNLNEDIKNTCYVQNVTSQVVPVSIDTSASATKIGRFFLVIIQILFDSSGLYGSYRKIGGLSPDEGILQFRSSPNGTWNTICTSWPILKFDEDLLTNLCQQMGHNASIVWAYLDTTGGLNSSFRLQDFPLMSFVLNCEEEVGCSWKVDEENTPMCTLNQSIWIVCGSGISSSFLNLHVHVLVINTSEKVYNSYRHPSVQDKYAVCPMQCSQALLK